MSVPLYQAKAEFFRTLGHPARIRILELLSEREQPVRDLLMQIAVPPSNLSQQLAVLRRASLVVSRREEGEVLYALSVPEVRDLLRAARVVMARMASAQSELESQLSDAAQRSSW
ncbi:MAG: metalloregulator ArsR/SmtB family transcription factor [Actinomycetota bacterium]|nr:metalloregulator ArsR/SmtB family transcription factor [Actinomycetota bacterium]